jgi:hypothetical protein
MQRMSQNQKEEDSLSLNLSQEVGDTVGAIALDRLGKVASTVSSGGNWLKVPGRVGHVSLHILCDLNLRWSIYFNLIYSTFRFYSVPTIWFWLLGI